MAEKSCVVVIKQSQGDNYRVTVRCALWSGGFVGPFFSEDEADELSLYYSFLRTDTLLSGTEPELPVISQFEDVHS